MVVSFKVSKIGTRFCPKPKANPMPLPLQPSHVSFKVSKVGTRFCPKPKANPIPLPLQPSQDDQTQVHGYRRCPSEKGADIVSTESSPTVSKVSLKMSLENIVKDIPSLIDKSWTYGDIMEVESKLVKALHPNLHLDPTPKLDRLCQSPLPTKNDVVEAGENIDGMPNSSEKLSLIEGNEVSFTLNLYLDGYFIGKPRKYDATNQVLPKSLLPYDRSSETIFSAIESGHLPGDILDDIPVKYVDGSLLCEVRDYRRCSPAVSKASLKMSLENIVKDIPSLTDNSWKYGDIMEVESKTVKALHPNLHLDPTPKLDRLCQSPLPTKLNLQIKRPRNAVTSSNKIHGEKFRIDRELENSKCRLGDSRITTSNAIVKQTLENPAMQNLNPSIAMRSKNIVLDSSIPGFSMISHQSKYPMAVRTPRSLQEHRLIAGINSSRASAVKDVMYSYADNPNPSVSLHVKRENPDRESSSLSNIAKRMRSASTGVDAMQQIDSHVNALQGSDMNWQDTLLQQQAMARSIQYTGSGIQMFPQQVFEGGLKQETGAIQFASGQQGMRLAAKVDGAGINRVKNEVEMYARNLDPQQLRMQQRMLQHALMRPNFPETTWNCLGQQIMKEAKKENHLQHIQTPWLSHGTLPHCSDGSVGPSFRPSSLKIAPGSLQKEKAPMASHTAAVGTPSLTSNANNSTQRKQQEHLAAKRRSKSVSKTPAMNVVQKSPHQVFEGGLNQQAGGTQFGSSQQGILRLVPKAQQFEMERIDGAGIKCNLNPQQVGFQQRMAHHASVRPNFPQTTSNSPQLSSGILPHSLLSSKSGEFSKGSVGSSFRLSSMKNASGALQKEKAATSSKTKKKEKTAMASHTAAVGTPSTKATTDTPRPQQ